MPTTKLSLQDETSRAAYQTSQAAYRKASAWLNGESARWRQARRHLKLADDFGQNQNPQFEQAFGSIAFTYLQEKAPGLMPYVLGFQLLDRSDGGRNAVGAFVAQVGNKTIDIPMFFRNGELKGHQVMRLRNPEMFLPLREAFLDYLFSKLPQDLGSNGPSADAQSPVKHTPDIQPFSGNRYLKGASDLDWLHDWAKESQLAEQYSQLRFDTKNLELGISLLDRKKNSHCMLSDILGQPAGLPLLKTAAKLCDGYPEFRKLMDRTLGDGWLRDAAIRAKTESKTAIQLPISRNPKLRLNVPSPKVSALSFTKNQLPVKLAGLNHDKIASEIDRYGEYADDRRTSDKLAISYKIEDCSLMFAPPSCSGKAQVLDADGKKFDAIVVLGRDRYGDGITDLILTPDRKRFCNKSRDTYTAVTPAVVTEPAGTTTESLLKPVKRRPKANEVFLIWTDKQVVGPFYVSRKVSTDRFEVADLSSFGKSHKRDSNFSAIPSVGCGSGDIRELFFHGDQSPAYNDGTCVVRTGSQIVPLGSYTEDSDYPSSDPSYQDKFREQFRVDLLESDDLRITELQKFANLTAKRASKHAVELNGIRLSIGEGRRFLMQTVGLAKEAAEEIVNAGAMPSKYIVCPSGFKANSIRDFAKLAYAVQSIDMPTMDDHESVSESGRYTITQPDEQVAFANPLPERQQLEPWEDPQGSDPTLSPSEQGVMQQDPSDTLGDMTGLLAILRNSRIDGPIKQLSKALLDAIDKLGRQILTFNGHIEEYEEMYGSTDVKDLEAALESTFDQAGDLFITLTRRANDPNPELDIADLST
jgi:hypothetical protein